MSEAQTAATGDSRRARLSNISSLRSHAARGTILNSGVQIGLSGLGLLQRLIVAAFLTRADFGLWALILTMIINLSWLKNVGVADKYLQQDEDDQELAFQKAFTLELYSSIIFFFLVLTILPLWASAYDHQEMIVPGIVTALVVPINAFQSPAWIAYRQLQYARQRMLTSVSIVVGFVVTVALAVAGMNYWCFVIGAVAGAVAGSVVCAFASPYPFRLRFDRATLRELRRDSRGLSWLPASAPCCSSREDCWWPMTPSASPGSARSASSSGS